MHRSILASTLFLALLPALGGAQEPPPSPPEEAEESEPKEVVPAEAQDPADESEVSEPSQEQGEEDAGKLPERVLTPEEEEIRRKAAEKAAKREERREKRAAKEAEEAAKRAEKRAREAMKRDERVDELIALGHASIETGKYKDAQGQFDKARELNGGRSFEAEMGVAQLELARGNYAQSVQFAQRAAAATLDAKKKAEALTFAGKATLAARPMREDDPTEPQPGSEIFVDSAVRFYIRAVEVSPFGAEEAYALLEERFPGDAGGSRADRLLTQYLDSVDNAEVLQGQRVAAAYEALLSGPKEGSPVAVVGPISPPKRLTGERPQLPDRQGAPAKRRLAVGFVVQPDGSVARVEILDTISPGAKKQAQRTLMDWTFEPARLPDGRPVTSFWLQGVSVSPE